MTPGADAVVRVPEIPDRTFPGKVTRIADALQSDTRTLLTEIDLPNPDGALAPGNYCTVELKLPPKTLSFVVPAVGLIDRNGLQVAVINNGKAEIRKVTVTRDVGTQLEVDHAAHFVEGKHGAGPRRAGSTHVDPPPFRIDLT